MRRPADLAHAALGAAGLLLLAAGLACSLRLPRPEAGPDDGGVDADGATDAGRDAEADVEGDGEDADEGGPSDGGDADLDVEAEADAEGDSAPECLGPSDCADDVDCTVDECVDGRCLNRPQPSLCTAPATCDRTFGCAKVLHVAVGAEGGDGSASAPFGSICAALAATVDRDTAPLNLVRVAAGRYVESCEYTKAEAPVTILGIPDPDLPEWRGASDKNHALKAAAAARVELWRLKMGGVDRAVECQDGVCAFEEMSLVGSGHEAVKAKGRSDVILRRCFVYGNEGAGVLLEESGGLVAINSIFARNGLAAAGGTAVHLASAGASLRAVNCTIADNGFAPGPGAVASESDAVELVNVVLWGNASDAGTPDCERCPLSVPSLLRVDPLFVRPDGARIIAEDYRLRPFSPAIDAGVAGPEVPADDYFGFPRDDGAPDIGAHEVRR